MDNLPRARPDSYFEGRKHLASADYPEFTSIFDNPHAKKTVDFNEWESGFEDAWDQYYYYDEADPE